MVAYARGWDGRAVVTVIDPDPSVDDPVTIQWPFDEPSHVVEPAEWALSDGRLTIATPRPAHVLVV